MASAFTLLAGAIRIFVVAPVALAAKGLKSLGLGMAALNVAGLAGAATSLGKLVPWLARMAGLAVGLAAVGTALGAVFSGGLLWLYNNGTGVIAFLKGFAEGLGLLEPVQYIASVTADGLMKLANAFSTFFGKWDVSRAKWRQWGHDFGSVFRDNAIWPI